MPRRRVVRAGTHTIIGGRRLDPALVTDVFRCDEFAYKIARLERHERFSDGEVEPCINGRTVALGAYFGVDVTPVINRLLGEQMVDGGWNCEQENGSTRGSFHTTIDVLEGLLAYERAAGNTPEVAKAVTVAVSAAGSSTGKTAGTACSRIDARRWHR